MYFKEDT